MIYTKSVKILSILLALIYFSNLFLNSFFGGGGWILSEQIAFAQRLIEGDAIYANGKTDLFFPSSPYFPGVGLISFLYSIIVTENIYINQYMMLATAVIFGIIFFIQVQKLTLMIYPQLTNTFVLAMTTLFYATHLKGYIVYMINFKPDTVLLVIGLSALFLLEKNIKPNYKSFIVVGLLLFICVFFKQTFFAIYFIVFLIVILNKYLSTNEKISITICYTFIGALALMLVFSVDNIYYFTVESISQNLMQDVSSIFSIFRTSFLYNIILFSSLLFFIYKRYSYFSISKLETKYFIFAVVWCIISFLSAAKEGGNRGNVEVGIIVFIPFAIYALNEITKEQINRFFSSLFIIALLISGIFVYSTKAFMRTINLAEKLDKDHQSIEFLSDEFKNKNVFVDGKTYILAKASGLNIVTEYMTIIYLNDIPDYDLNRLKNAIDSNVYDLFFLKKTNPCIYKQKTICNKQEKFISYQHKNLPEHLEGQLLLSKQ